MCRFVVGQKVTHLLSGELLIISKINKSIAVCEIEKPYFMAGTKVLINKIICQISNLTEHEKNRNTKRTNF